MQSRTVLLGGVALLGAVATLAAVFAPRALNLRYGRQAAPGAAHLVAFTGRSPAQRAASDSDKMDAALADLVRHAPRARRGHALADLHAMNPAARFRPAEIDGQALVLVDAVTRGDVGRLKTALVGLGLEHPSVFSNDVGGWLPVSRIADTAALPELTQIRAAMPRTRAGSGIVATQGDYAQRSSVVRAAYPSLTGSGVTVGVLSDSFDCYEIYAQPGSGVPVSGYQGYAFNGFTATAEDDEAGGALPATVSVLAEPYTATPTVRGDCTNYGAPTQTPFTDEGRAMLQIVHAVAPGANLAFYTGDDSEADFANGIVALAGAGAKVIADDLGYFDEPFYEDGIVAQAIDSVEAPPNNVAYFSAAGNNANSSWESTAPSFPTQATSGPNAGEFLLNFDTSGTTTATSLPITIAPLFPGEFLGIIVEWDQPYVTGYPASLGATSHIDVCLTGATGDYVIQDYDDNNGTTPCTGANSSGVDPVQVLIIGNPANASASTSQQVLNLMVGLADGTAGPGRLIVSVQTDGQTNPPPISTYATNSESLQGHPGAAGAAAVGAAFYFQTPQCGTTPALLEPYSSLGGAPILFDASGRLATPIVRQKPDFVGPDGVNTTFLGFQLASNDINGIEIGANGLLPTSIAACQNDASFPNFFGTSAATPHAAGIAALMLQANPSATPSEIYQALRLSALPMTGSGPTPNFFSGYGFIQADLAFVVPALTLGSNVITLGSSTSLTWSTIDATSCTASGAWSGAQTPNGTVTLTPGAAGVTSYTLACTNLTGATAQSTVTLSTGTAFATDTYSGGVLSIPTMTIGSVTYSNLVVVPGTILSGPSGGSGNGAVDTYNPANGQLTIPNVRVGANTFHNVIITVASVQSIGSVAGADAYKAPDLTIPSVQVGDEIYNNVTITVTDANILHINGGMPAAVRDQYSGGILNIPAVSAAGRVFTNVAVTVGSIVSVGGIDVPNVVGQTQAAATTALAAAQLVVGTVSTASSAAVPAGEVISQSPAAGQDAALGSAVNIAVSTGLGGAGGGAGGGGGGGGGGAFDVLSLDVLAGLALFRFR
jgi:PASTA domain-containing protein/subtilase family protein